MSDRNGIGWAVKQMADGQQVQREGWNGKDMWIALVPGVAHGLGNDPGGSRERPPWVGMRTADNKFIPWLCSQADLLAVDWRIVHE